MSKIKLINVIAIFSVASVNCGFGLHMRRVDISKTLFGRICQQLYPAKYAHIKMQLDGLSLTKVGRTSLLKQIKKELANISLGQTHPNEFAVINAHLNHLPMNEIAINVLREAIATNFSKISSALPEVPGSQISHEIAALLNEILNAEDPNDSIARAKTLIDKSGLNDENKKNIKEFLTKCSFCTIEMLKSFLEKNCGDEAGQINALLDQLAASPTIPISEVSEIVIGDLAPFYNCLVRFPDTLGFIFLGILLGIPTLALGFGVLTLLEGLSFAYFCAQLLWRMITFQWAVFESLMQILGDLRVYTLGVLMIVAILFIQTLILIYFSIALPFGIIYDAVFYQTFMRGQGMALDFALYMVGHYVFWVLAFCIANFKCEISFPDTSPTESDHIELLNACKDRVSGSAWGWLLFFLKPDYYDLRLVRALPQGA